GCWSGRQTGKLQTMKSRPQAILLSRRRSDATSIPSSSANIEQKKVRRRVYSDCWRWGFTLRVCAKRPFFACICRARPAFRTDSEDDLRGKQTPLGDERVRSRLLNLAHIAYHGCGTAKRGELHEHLREHISAMSEWPKGELVREIVGNPF